MQTLAVGLAEAAVYWKELELFLPRGQMRYRIACSRAVVDVALDKLGIALEMGCYGGTRWKGEP